MKNNFQTVEEYLRDLPVDRRNEIEKVRQVILENLPAGYEEIIQYGMIGYGVPLEIYPAGYMNDKTKPVPYAALASQKNYMAIYLMNIYGNKETEEWFIQEYKKSGKKLDMGKSCIRFKKADDLALDVLGKTIARTSVENFIEIYQKARQ